MSKRLNKKQVQEIKNTSTLIDRNDLRLDQSWETMSFFELPDKRILTESSIDGKGELFMNQEEWTNLITDIISQGPQHILAGYFFDDYNIEDKLEAAKPVIEKYFLIDRALLTCTYAILQQMDSHFNKRKITKKVFFKELFPYMVLWLTQTVVNEEKLQWKLEYDSETKIWLPCVQLHNGKVIYPFSSIQEFAYEEYSQFSLYEAATLCLARL